MSARPAVVGGFILGALGLGVAAILFFGGMQLFTTTSSAVVFFSESLAGLDVGAPVTFHGVRIGSVQSIGVQFSSDTMTARTPVRLELQPNLITWQGRQLTGAADFDRLVKAGLRAQLALQSLVTGQLRVDLDLRPGTLAQLVGTEPSMEEIPAVPSELGQLRNELTNLPLREVVQASQRTLTSIGHLSDHLDAKLDSLTDSALHTADDAQRTLTSLQRLSDHLDAKIDGLADTTARTLQTTDDAVRRVQTDASATLRDLDSLLIDAHRQLDVRGDELSRTLRASDRA
ncbi:MAG: MCE family protein, partial [Alphaproteobacteria bacterium]|nr:MCE family protein [Alphaproteobacteria bacterium]